MDDKLAWPLLGIGSFSVSSTYNLIAKNCQPKETMVWVWRIKCIEKVKSFIWPNAKESLLTNAERAKRGMTPDYMCRTCNEHEETKDHLFKNCRFIEECLRRCLRPDFISRWRDTSRCTNGSNKTARIIPSWKVISNGVCTSPIWCGKVGRPETRGFLGNFEDTVQWKVVKNADRAAREAGTFLTKRRVVEGGSLRRIGWDPLNSCWLKLNSNKAMKSSTSLASVGGLIYDNARKWVLGFTMKIGEADSFTTEL